MSRVDNLEQEIAAIDEEMSDLALLILASNTRVKSLKAKKALRHSELFQSRLEEQSTYLSQGKFQMQLMQLMNQRCNCREHAGDMEDCPVHAKATALHPL